MIDHRRFASLGALALALASCVTASSRSVGTEQLGAIEFIDHLVAVFPATTGISVSFTGSFSPIPGELESELQHAFPEVRFQIAEMLYTHWGPDPVNLLVASDRDSGRVLTYLWSLWFTSPTPAFVAILNSRSWRNESEFRSASVTLAKLVAYCMDGRVGEVGYEPAEPGKFLSLDKVTVELFNRHNRLWRVMKVRFQRVSGYIAPSVIEFEQTAKSGGATFSKLNVPPNNRLKLTVRPVTGLAKAARPAPARPAA